MDRHDAGYNDASRTLRWDDLRGGISEDELLRLLRQHAGALGQLHVA